MTPSVHEDKLPIDSLATMNDEGTMLLLGVVPAVVVVVIAVVFTVVYFYRRSKSWNEIGEAMRLDHGDQPIANTNFDETFSTQNILRLDPTVPAKRFDKNGAEKNNEGSST